ncbi:MAG: RNA polymerase factor sigma-54 [Pseudomonadota bacterium]
MKQSLQLKIGQQLAMTPQLQQAIRLLQLSTLELQTEIQEALEANPMLEAEDESNSAAENESEKTSANETIASMRDAADAAAGDTDAEPAAEVMPVQNENIPDELPVDSRWDDIYEPSFSNGSGSNSEPSRDFTEYYNEGTGSLRDHLLEQIHLRPLSSRDRDIAAALIDAIDDNGYLTEDLDDILEGLNRDLANPDDLHECDEVEAMMRLVQHLDPPGCGARDVGECILLQLENTAKGTKGLQDALLIVSEHLSLLAAHDYAKLKRQTRLSDEALYDAVSLIKTLNPHPGSKIVSGDPQYIVPDVFVRKEKGIWRVELNPDIAPKIGINQTYSSMIKRADKSQDNQFMRNHLQEARWFIKSLQSRNETLLRVATAIVGRQRGFLEYGEESMKPMVLRDIAEQLEMHESTISRVTTQKFMHTPRGIFEFKYFFSSHVNTVDGGECSATAIRAMIRKLIESENAQKPLSDNKIANVLVENGINVARRTVAKYREGMTIPPSNERKRLN